MMMARLKRVVRSENSSMYGSRIVWMQQSMSSELAEAFRSVMVSDYEDCGPSH